MNVRRLMMACALTGLTVGVLAGLLSTSPLSAAGISTVPSHNGGYLAPAADEPTLIPSTPDNSGGFPPFDLGPLNSPSTPTATPTAAPQGENEVVIDQPFDECAPIDDQYIHVECTNGELAFTRKETQGTRWLYYDPTLTDAMIEVTTRLPSQKNAHYGVIFRLDDSNDNYYLVGVDNNGEYGLFRHSPDGYTSMIPYTQSDFVGNAGFPSKIQIVNQGDVIAINIGGQWLDSVRDDNLTAGRVALFVEPDEPNQTVLFDDLRVTSITTPIDVPTPRDITTEATPTEASGGFTFNFGDTATPAASQPTSAPAATQTPFIIVVTATPLPATATPAKAATRIPTRKPTAAACAAGANEAVLYISNNYVGLTMRFTIGGGDWHTHDYDVPGDGKYYLIHMPPGTYTYTAFIPGQGTAHGEKTAYNAGQCYSLRFSP